VARKNYYTLLGVEPDATQEEIREAYLARIRVVHPDRFDPNAESKAWTNANRFASELNEAYEILKDPVKRKRYDASRGHQAAVHRKEDKRTSKEAGREETSKSTTQESGEALKSGHAVWIVSLLLLCFGIFVYGFSFSSNTMSDWIFLVGGCLLDAILFWCVFYVVFLRKRGVMVKGFAFIVLYGSLFASSLLPAYLQGQQSIGVLSPLQQKISQVRELIEDSNALSLLAQKDDAIASDIEWESLELEAGALYGQGFDDGVREVGRNAVKGVEQSIHPKYSKVVNVLYNIAALFKTPDKQPQIESMYERELADREKTFGPDHPEVADALNNLALLYRTQGQYGEAEPLFKRALTILEKTYGPNHSSVAKVLENLAKLYRNVGRKDEARALERRATAIRATKRRCEM